MNKEITLKKQSIHLSNNNFIYISSKLQKQAKIQHFCPQPQKQGICTYYVYCVCPLSFRCLRSPFTCHYKGKTSVLTSFCVFFLGVSFVTHTEQFISDTGAHQICGCVSTQQTIYCDLSWVDNSYLF